MSGPELQSRSMSGPMALSQLGSVLRFVGHATTKGCANAQDLGHQLRPHWYPRAMLSLGPYRYKCSELLLRAMVMSGPELRSGLSGSVVLLQP